MFVACVVMEKREMKKLAVGRPKRLPQTIDADRGALADPFAAGPAAAPRTPRVSFRYSYTEISATGRDARIKHTQMRFEEGKLTSESFEGAFDREAADDMLRHAGEYWLRQSSLLLKSLLWFLPAAGGDRRHRD